MMTLKITLPNGHKEYAHCQTLEKCEMWMNLYYKKFTLLTLIDNKTGKSADFDTKLDFEEYCAAKKV